MRPRRRAHFRLLALVTLALHIRAQETVPPPTTAAPALTTAAPAATTAPPAAPSTPTPTPVVDGEEALPAETPAGAPLDILELTAGQTVVRVRKRERERERAAGRSRRSRRWVNPPQAHRGIRSLSCPFTSSSS